MGGQAGGAGILEEARSTVGPLWDVPGRPLPIHSNFSRKAGVPEPLWQRGSPESELYRLGCGHWDKPLPSLPGNSPKSTAPAFHL